MQIRRVRLLALIALPLLLFGCKVNTINSFPSNPAHVRAVNLFADVPAINVSVGSTPTWSGVPVEGYTGYQDFDNTRQTFTVTVPGATTALNTADFDLAGTQSYSLTAYGQADFPVMALLADGPLTVAPNNIALRFVNVAITAGPVDLYIVTPGTDISTVGASSTDIIYGSATNARVISTGTYELILTQTGTLTIIYDSGPVTFADQSFVNVYFYTRTGGVLANADLVPINTGGTSGVLENLYARLRVINAAPDVAATNVVQDFTPIFAQVAYGTPAPYQNAAPGNHTYKFEDAATPGATIASVAGQLIPSDDYTEVLMGPAGATTAILLNDNNLLPQDSNAKVRFINAAAGTPPLNLIVNGTTLAASTAPGTAAPYAQIGGGTYDVTVQDATTGATVASLSGIDFPNGEVLTIYAYGRPGALQAQFIQDR